MFPAVTLIVNTRTRLYLYHHFKHNSSRCHSTAYRNNDLVSHEKGSLHIMSTNQATESGPDAKLTNSSSAKTKKSNFREAAVTILTVAMAMPANYFMLTKIKNLTKLRLPTAYQSMGMI